MTGLVTDSPSERLVKNILLFLLECCQSLLDTGDTKNKIMHIKINLIIDYTVITNYGVLVTL